MLNVVVRFSFVFFFNSLNIQGCNDKFNAPLNTKVAVDRL